MPIIITTKIPRYIPKFSVMMNNSSPRTLDFEFSISDNGAHYIYSILWCQSVNISFHSTRVPYQLERIVTVMIRFWLLWFIFHVTFGFLVLLWFCYLLRPFGSKIGTLVLVWF
jgi:hypothetical protein